MTDWLGSDEKRTSDSKFNQTFFVGFGTQAAA